jgi:hypothetical protein
MFAETDEKVIKANVCVNVALIPPPSAGGRPRLKTYRQEGAEILSISYTGIRQVEK